MSMFEQAIRRKLRFETARGALSVEDLWDLPLTSTKATVTLDDIAKGIYRQLRESGDTVSFVKPIETHDEELQLKFDVVKHVIDVLVTERDAANEAAKRRATKQRILELVEQKRDQELAGKSVEELMTLANSL